MIEEGEIEVDEAHKMDEEKAIKPVKKTDVSKSLCNACKSIVFYFWIILFLEER